MVDKEAVLAGYEAVAAAYTADRSPDQEERDALRSFLVEVPPDAEDERWVFFEATLQ